MLLFCTTITQSHNYLYSAHYFLNIFILVIDEPVVFRSVGWLESKRVVGTRLDNVTDRVESPSCTGHREVRYEGRFVVCSQQYAEDGPETDQYL